MHIDGAEIPWTLSQIITNYALVIPPPPPPGYTVEGDVRMNPDALSSTSIPLFPSVCRFPWPYDVGVRW